MVYGDEIVNIFVCAKIIQLVIHLMAPVTVHVAGQESIVKTSVVKEHMDKIVLRSVGVKMEIVIMFLENVIAILVGQDHCEFLNVFLN